MDYEQMEYLGGEQYSEYLMESNPRTYLSMRDYMNQSWPNEQPVERNPNEYRSMSEYGNQWMSSPYGSSYNHSWGNHTNASWEPRPPQYAAYEPPYYAPTSQQQPPPLSPIEQAILNLSKQVDNFIEDNRAVNVQGNREIEKVESSLDKELDGFQSKIDQKLDILQESISKLTNQLVHKKEENLEEECLTDTFVGEEAQLQPEEELKEEPAEAPPQELQDAPQLCIEYGPWKREEEILPLWTEEGSGSEVVEEHQDHNLPLPPIDSVSILPSPAPQSLPRTPAANAQTTYSPLLAAPPDQVYILPTPTAAPAPKIHATPSLPMLKNFKKLVAPVQIFATTSRKMAVAYVAWHSGWFGCRFGFGAPEPRHS